MLLGSCSRTGAAETFCCNDIAISAKMWLLRELALWIDNCHAGLRTRVQVPRTHINGRWVHSCNSRAQKVETGDTRRKTSHMGELGGQARDPASMNKVQHNGGRLSVSTSGFHTHAHAPVHTLHSHMRTHIYTSTQHTHTYTSEKHYLPQAPTCPHLSGDCSHWLFCSLESFLVRWSF